MPDPHHNKGTTAADQPPRAPRGTRDLYPEDALRRRYITETWRRVALRHAFDEVDGPTFEHLRLYTIKSGEGIVSELFSFQREGGDETFALRPEFTPTLARLYAARAAQLPKPTRWFSVGPFFRAERPQRGRLREFLQWNCDVLNDDSATADADIAAVAADALGAFGLRPENTRLKISNRDIVARELAAAGVQTERADDAFALLDKRPKLEPDAFAQQATNLGLDLHAFDERCAALGRGDDPALDNLLATLRARAVHDWAALDFSIVRGLAYYTGTVFEVIAEGERAVAGGGRYDKLIELVGGPPTPAVGFAMGDVVLANLLDDRNLMPGGAEILRALDRPVPTTPDVFLITNGADDAEAAYDHTLAHLRRGIEREGFDGPPWSADRYAVPPLHARRTSKATRNVGKLLKEAAQHHARAAAIIESAEHATIKHLASGEQVQRVPLDQLGATIAERFSDPAP